MYYCPISSEKLIKARAAGKTIWYSPISKGRMITAAVSRHFFGKEGTTEIWVRARQKDCPLSWKRCPSCSKKMKEIQESRWLNSHKIDVCLKCFIFWIDVDEHIEVPHPEDLLEERGDSTLTSDIASAQADVAIMDESAKFNKEKLVGKGPDKLLKQFIAFTELPVEMSERGIPKKPWLSWFVAVSLFLIHYHMTAGNPELLNQYGLYPNNIFNDFGLNILRSTFFHQNWFQLVVSLYFFGIFSDDLEDYFGRVKYIGLLLFSAVFTGFSLAIFSRSPELAHVGLSGIIISLITLYALTFSKSRIAYLFPYTHYFTHSSNSFAFIRSLGWVRLPVYTTLIIYLVMDLLVSFSTIYVGVESYSLTTSLSGVLAGFIFWLFVGKPNWYRETARV